MTTFPDVGLGVTIELKAFGMPLAERSHSSRITLPNSGVLKFHWRTDHGAPQPPLEPLTRKSQLFDPLYMAS
jgi:hypothetical protein